MKKNIWKHFTILLLIALSVSCATKPPDTLVCVEVSLIRGECIKIMSGEKVRIDEDHKLNGKTWWEMRPTNLVIPAFSYAEQKAFFITLCKKSKKLCEQEVASWDRTLETIDSKLKEKEK